MCVKAHWLHALEVQSTIQHIHPVATYQLSCVVQLADEIWGVIGLRYRRTDCSFADNNTTPPKTLAGALSASTVASPSVKQAIRSTRSEITNREKVERQSVKTTSVFEGEFSTNFIDGGLVPYKPQNGDGFGGRPAWCSIVSAKRGVSILGQPGSFRKGFQLEFWVKMTNGVPDISVALASNKVRYSHIDSDNLWIRHQHVFIWPKRSLTV